ncbi:hypothetical protein ACFWNG_03855 [Streptomyces sp. NPDC058391]|uniref:hypothetical protein n=1 Tax=Streptomyces sp. NPDC058391 TaxID=3346476 RepID=UPI003668522D
MAKFSSEKYPALTLQDDKGIWARFEGAQFETFDSAVAKRLRGLPESEGISEVGGSEPADDKAPSKRASKDDWVAWAVKTGATEEEASALTRDELAEKYADSAPKE